MIMYLRDTALTLATREFERYLLTIYSVLVFILAKCFRVKGNCGKAWLSFTIPRRMYDGHRKLLVARLVSWNKAHEGITCLALVLRLIFFIPNVFVFVDLEVLVN